MTINTSAALALDDLPNSPARLPAVDKTHTPECRLQLVTRNAPSQRPQHASESVVSDSGLIPRKTRKSRNEIRKSLHNMLNAAVPLRLIPAREVARHVESSIDTIEARRQGNIPIAWAEMVEYCRAYPAFGMEVLELMGIDIDQDRNAFVMFLQLQKQVRGG